jgi:hypothetical protein
MTNSPPKKKELKNFVQRETEKFNSESCSYNAYNFAPIGYKEF